MRTNHGITKIISFYLAVCYDNWAGQHENRSYATYNNKNQSAAAWIPPKPGIHRFNIPGKTIYTGAS